MKNILFLMILFFSTFANADTAKALKQHNLKEFVDIHDMRLTFVLENKKVPYSGFLIPPSDFVLFKTEFEYMEREINSIVTSMTDLCNTEISSLVKKHHISIQQMVDDNIKLSELLKAKEDAFNASLKEEKIKTRNYTLVGILTGAIIAGTTVFLLK